jgi:exonuclease III
MRIITWNCNMCFRKKAELVLKYEPDILVIPECEEPGKLQFPSALPAPRDVLWFGSNQHKGLGIFSYGNCRLKLKRNHQPRYRTIVPILVSKGEIQFTLYAIWAHNPDDPEGRYITQVWKAIHYYKRHIHKNQTLLIGDFNSNTIWDRPRRKGNHSDVVAHLQRRGIHSTYHHHFKQLQGSEQHPTLYMYRHKDKPYHIDYCFASEDLLQKLQSVEIGEYAFWKQYSDHVPVIVTFGKG